MKRGEIAATLVAVLLSGAAGCAAPQAQLPPDVLLRMQADARTEIYDRENDLAIARNRVEDLRIRGQQQRLRLAELEAGGQRVRQRLAKAGGADRAGLIDKPLAARRRYLAAQLNLTEGQLTVADAQVTASRGRLEQTRQRELVRTGRVLARSMKPFDKNVESLERRVRDLERRQQDLRVETEKSYEAWKGSEDEYARATGDWDTAIWVD